MAWVIWFWLLIRCFADIFCPARPRAGAIVLWMIVLIVLPFLGVFVYLIVQSEGMAECDVSEVKAS